MVTKGILVEDEVLLAQSIMDSLSEKGIEMCHVDSVSGAKEIIESKEFDFCILDVGLKDGEGYEVAEYINQSSSIMPIIFLTARSGSEDRLKGYELGAVEYIPKPFLFQELWIRLKHVLNDHVIPNEIDLGSLKVKVDSYSFCWDDGEVNFLSEKEFKVFLCLYNKSPQVVRRSDLLDEVWGGDAYPTERTVDNVVLRLRQLLKSHGKKVRSVRGVGYQWISEG